MFKSTTKIDNWIFVTGVPRSGTTFVGMNLSLSKQVDYIHEPFNPTCGMPDFMLPSYPKWYRYLSGSTSAAKVEKYKASIESIFDYSLSLKNLVPRRDPLSRKIVKSIIGSRGPYYLRLAKLNPWSKASVIKDPVGILLTEYLYLNYKVKPVIIVKHPLSFIASLKRVNFWPNPWQIRGQEDLVNDFFAQEAADLEEQDFFDRQWSDPVVAAAVFWRIVYKVVLAQASKHSDWIVLTHEELSQRPLATFKDLYKQLGLNWSEEIERKIRRQTEGNKSAEAKKGVVQDFKRNSADIFQLRRDSLSKQERKAIFEVTKDIALQKYSEASFALD